MKKISLICAALLSACTIVGCTKAQTNEEQSDVKISFSWWGNDKRHMYTMDGVDLFETKNPGIDVSISYGIWTGFEIRNQVSMESKSETDVMQINYNWLFQYSADGEGYYDLYQLKDIIDLTAYNEEYLSYGVVNGKLNAIPIAMNTPTTYYNADIYDKYGLEYPKTWDDLFNVAQVLSKDDIYVLGIAKKQAIILLYSYYEQLTGRQAFDKEGNFLLEKEDMAVIVDFYKRLLDEKVLMPIDDYTKTAFVNGEMSGTIIWVSDAGNYCNALAAASGHPVLGEYPTMEGAKASGRYLKPATMYAISANTKNPEEAAKLVNFLVSDKDFVLMQGTEKGVPVSSVAVSHLQSENALGTYEYEASQAMNRDADEMAVLYPAMENDTALEAFKNDALEYIFDKSDLDSVAEKICADIRQALSK